ncbi:MULTISPECIES: hypothetical protein [Okeania]|uniref:Uncharacterized protein n=1 Tax=Okeania hirsuta TaxID=1458930 RepID=A0A3N6PHB5_9CYAN|nr:MULTISPECIES: hypothetical protein [Okeania]NET79520.1 hypothetical protein [Okeania sp. SIO1F9]RQH14403.1 hypothetical protein D4Z78_22840 [Okeania hirsuta]RQH31042.1 hypothetical protein D5R40_23585 [Okeania hirsuta]
MATLKRFNTPAGLKDLGDQPDKQAQLDALWNQSLNEFTEQSIQGGRAPLDNDRTFYFNPLSTNLTGVVTPPPVAWTAFPNRILLTFPNASRAEQLRYADESPPNVGGRPYGPEGPRGWQDEYCEWSVTRRTSDNKITKVTFTCENREYWFALWMIDPNRVLELYRELVSPDVQLSDIQGDIDPNTKLPSYNYLNKWNNNTTTGPVHLISRPNSLSAEIYLAAAATIVRDCNGEVVTNQSQLIQCSLYGTPGRNSDPFIGGTVNSIVRPGGVKVTLKDPVGLYIQEPAFDQTWQLPSQAPIDAHPSDYWKIVRGYRRTDPNEPDFILHAVYEVPEEQGFCVGDITIDGVPIIFGSQITQKFQIALAAIGIPTTEPNQTPRPCIDSSACPSESAEVVSAAVDPAHLSSMKSLMSSTMKRL